ncbi:MAG: S41 family peptidase [Clostridia bacterium]
MNHRGARIGILAFSLVVLVAAGLAMLPAAGFRAATRAVAAAGADEAGPPTSRNAPSHGRAGEMLLQPEDMLEDLQYVSSVVEQVHPALSSRSAQDEFAARVEATKAELHEPLPAWRFFALVNAVVASLRDAHTSLRLPDSGGILPVGLTWAEDGIVVSRVLDPTLPVQPGDELISLGGRTPERLLADLCAWVPHGNPYWVKALGSRYLENPLVLKGLGLVSGQEAAEGKGGGEWQETVQMVVRRPTARWPGSGQPLSSGSSDQGAFPSQEPPVAQESQGASKGSEGAVTAGAALAAEIPIWGELTVTGTAPDTDPSTGRVHSPAAEAGVRPGDRVLAADGSPVLSAGDLSRLVQKCGQEGRELTLEVLRRGERLRFSMRPIPRSRRDPGSAGAAYVIGVILGGAPAPAEEKRPWFGWTVDRSAGYGLFWLDECNNTREYRRAVDEFFAAVRKDGVERIAVDLRRNGGGDSMVVGAFLKYLPYTYGDLRAPSRSTRHSPQLARQRGLWLRLFAWVGETFFNGRWLPYPIQPRAAADELFRGEVYVLTSWRSFSSAVDFAAILSDNRLAQVVGAPTGGTPTEYGDTLSFTMPNTGWRFTVSTTRFARPDPARDPADALYPDIPVSTAVQDVREGRDPVLEWLRGVRVRAER